MSHLTPPSDSMSHLTPPSDSMSHLTPPSENTDKDKSLQLYRNPGPLTRLFKHLHPQIGVIISHDIYNISIQELRDKVIRILGLSPEIEITSLEDLKEQGILSHKYFIQQIVHCLLKGEYLRMGDILLKNELQKTSPEFPYLHEFSKALELQDLSTSTGENTKPVVSGNTNQYKLGNIMSDIIKRKNSTSDDNSELIEHKVYMGKIYAQQLGIPFANTYDYPEICKDYHAANNTDVHKLLNELQGYWIAQNEKEIAEQLGKNYPDFVHFRNHRNIVGLSIFTNSKQEKIFIVGVNNQETIDDLKSEFHQVQICPIYMDEATIRHYQGNTGSPNISEIKNIDAYDFYVLRNNLLLYTQIVGASDIEIKGDEYSSTIRVKIGNTWKEIHTIDNNNFIEFINLQYNVGKTAKGHEPREGENTYNICGNYLATRAQYLPTDPGKTQEIVIRVHQKETKQLYELEIPPRVLQSFENHIKYPKQGITLIAGAMGTGKSTLERLLLEELAKIGKFKILTYENPIEKIIPFTSQYNKGNTLNKVSNNEIMEALLRTGSDIFKSPEIRSPDEANLLMQAADTGLTVFSSIHSTTAAEVIKRISNMNINPKIFINMINTIYACKLLPELCDTCCTPFTNEHFELQKLHLTPEMMNIIKEKMEKGEIRQKSNDGCEACHGTGTKGKIQIIEMLEFFSELKDFITEKEEQKTISELNQFIKKNYNHNFLIQEAFRQWFHGKCDIEVLLNFHNDHLDLLPKNQADINEIYKNLLASTPYKK